MDASTQPAEEDAVRKAAAEATLAATSRLSRPVVADPEATLSVGPAAVFEEPRGTCLEDGTESR
eukprot:3142268-Alexandrium_andersonii.AAC.1